MQSSPFALKSIANRDARRLTSAWTTPALPEPGAAIDLDTEHNPLGRAWRPEAGMMPMLVVALFEGAGWK